MSNSNNTVPWLPVVTEVDNGQPVSGQTVNDVTDQLVQRDEYLYSALQNIQDKSVLVALGLPINPTETGILPGYQFVVAYTTNPISGNTGIVRALSAFTNSYSTSFYSAANTAYTYGITQNIYSASSTADVYLSGQITFTVPLDNPTYGMLDFVSPGVRETFRPGPYYLSSKNPGLITSNPSGLICYVGTAPNNTTLLLNPDTNNFSELYQNYQFNVLGRPTGVPVLTAGNWTIPSGDLTRLGWVDVSSLPSSYTIPPGACFFYNIPVNFNTDNADNGGTGSLTAAQEAQAQQLYGLLPPDPTNFINLSVNGVLQEFQNGINNNPIYILNDFGLWWLTRADPFQPWSDSLAAGWTPANWKVNQGTFPPNIYISFCKLNPNLDSALVTSLAPYTDGSSVVLEVVSKQSPTTPATVGDLYIKYNLQFNTNTVLASSPTGVADFTYNQTTGLLTKSITPIVSTLTTPANSGLTLTNDGQGNLTIAQEGQGNTGPLDDIDEYNANYEYLGLNSYLRLKYNTAVTAGFTGKITLPSNFPSDVNLYIVVQVFGFANVASTPLSAGYSFQYAVSTAGAVASNTTTFTTTSLAPALITFPASYVANTVLTAQPTQFMIPAASIAPNSIVNFRVLQQNPSSNPYNNDVALLTAYWSLL